MTLEESIAGKQIPKEILETQTLLDVPYLAFDGSARTGQLLLHKDLVGEVKLIFESLLDRKFRIEKMIPVVAFNWDDVASMEANNTSAFNYRPISGTSRLSMHSYGRAIDINPMQNPYVYADGRAVPKDAYYDVSQSGTVTAEIADIFKTYGWRWGGDWTDRKDWQHFEKPFSGA